MDELHKQFVDRMDTALDSIKLPRYMLAKMAGIGKDDLRRWRTMGKHPNMSTLLRMCDKLKISPLYILGYDDTPLLPQKKDECENTCADCKTIRNITDSILLIARH